MHLGTRTPLGTSGQHPLQEKIIRVPQVGKSSGMVDCAQLGLCG